MVTVTLSTTGCEKRPATLIVERQTLVPGPKGSPNAIARTEAGELIVAGGRFTAWAFGASADGKLLWKYEEAHDDTIKTQYHGEFKGVVPLSSGNTLLCGETQSRSGGGLIVVLDQSGQLVERRTLFPNDEPKYFTASFEGCMPWNGSVLLLGRASDGTHPGSWFMRLDMTGKKVWELFTPEIPSHRAVQTPDGGLIVTDPAAGGTLVARLNRNFEVIARRTLTSSADALLRPVDGASDTTRLVVYTYDGKVRLFTLNGQLQDERKPQAIKGVGVNQGCGYVLSDGSLALFGSTLQRGTGRAAAAHLRPGQFIEVRSLDEAESDAFTATLTVTDAVPITKTRFVAASERNSRFANDAGVVLSWLRFE